MTSQTMIQTYTLVLMIGILFGELTADPFATHHSTLSYHLDTPITVLILHPSPRIVPSDPKSWTTYNTNSIYVCMAYLVKDKLTLSNP